MDAVDPSFDGGRTCELPQELSTDPDRTCFEKAKATGEPTFTLRAQDVTADLSIDFWLIVQQEVRRAMNDGATIEEAKECVRHTHVVPIQPPMFRSLKIDGAAKIAEAMRVWPDRKVAD